MTRSEAVSQIEKIISNYDSFTKSVNSLVTQVGELSSSINGINYNSILNETAISLINTGLSKINNDISKINTACTSVVSTAKNDANKKIREIVDSYNASIADDPDAVKLSYQTVTGEVVEAAVASAPAASNSSNDTSTTPKTETPVENPTEEPATTENPDTTTTTETPTEDTNTDTNNETPSGNNNYNNYSGGYDNYNDTPEEPPTNYETIKNALDYYFAHSSTEKLNSSSIDSWDSYINQFLQENKLDSYVKNISIEDGVVICTLINGQQYKYENVTGIVDLLKKLQNSITRNGEGDTYNA